MKKMQDHFSSIALKYRKIRTTDLEPIAYIERTLKNFPKIIGADIGCGDGRYDISLFQHLGKKLYLYCIDSNRDMLDQLDTYLKLNKIENFQTINANAEGIPLSDNLLDCIFTSNAIHHFKLTGFLKESSRILKKNGYLFIYTRLRSQNRRNIWGKYFPLFNQKESRLYEIDELKEFIMSIPNLKLETIKNFKYKRVNSLDRLDEQAQNKHYSTFKFYSDLEFNQSYEKFNKTIRDDFKDLNNITWHDENILFVVKKID